MTKRSTILLNINRVKNLLKSNVDEVYGCLVFLTNDNNFGVSLI